MRKVLNGCLKSLVEHTYYTYRFKTLKTKQRQKDIQDDTKHYMNNKRLSNSNLITNQEL